MKKGLAIVLACLCCATCGIFGCTEGRIPTRDPEPIDPNALVVMGKSSDMERPYLQRAFSLYRATGKPLYVEKIPDDDFEKTAQKRFARGEGPDVFFHFHNDDLNRFDVPADFVYLDDEEWVSDLTPSAQKYCTSTDGHLLGLPFWESSVSGCYYNKTLLESLGVERAYEQTHFDSLCNTLKKNGITPICWPANGCSWMYQFALDPVFADKTADYDGPALLEQLNAGEIDYADIDAVRRAVDWIAKAEQSGWFGSNYNNIGWDQIAPELASGRAAMVFIWDTWFYTDFRDGKYTKDDFEVMPVFMDTCEGGTYEGGNLNMMMVNKNGVHREEALEFLRFCATPEVYNAAFEGIATVSCFLGQTTNTQSHMVENAIGDINKRERVSTASTKIKGYNADDIAAIFGKLFAGEVDAKGCLTLLDEDRKEKLRAELADA